MKRFSLGTKFLTGVSMLFLLPMTLSAAKQDNRPAVTTAAIPTNYKEICNALPSQKLQHPYLVFDETGKRAILDNIKKMHMQPASIGCSNSKGNVTCALTMHPNRP